MEGNSGYLSSPVRLSFRPDRAAPITIARRA